MVLKAFFIGGNKIAQRRMFSLQVIDTDEFLEMPVSARELYFQLGMRADDDGFVSNPKRIMKMISSVDDDLKVLLTKKFVIGFESGIVVIRHWKIHNYIQNDRYKETLHLDEKEMIAMQENNVYTNCIQNGNTGKDRLGKDRLGKDSINIIYECKFFIIDEIRHNNYKDLYPKLDLIHKYKEANQWLIDHPKKRYTDYGRFITNWLKNSYKYDNDKKYDEPEKVPDWCFPKKPKTETSNSLE